LRRFIGSLISRALRGIRNPRLVWKVVHWDLVVLLMRCRAWRLRLVGGHVGTDVLIAINVRIGEPSKFSIGNNSFINTGTLILAYDTGTIRIGNDVIIGPSAVLVSANHRYDLLDRPIRQQGEIYKPIIIEDDVWIGAHAVILPGVTVGKGSVIGAGSVVSK
jgi:acetyltransferase-like isoleucine patch superfamily enzyme